MRLFVSCINALHTFFFCSERLDDNFKVFCSFPDLFLNFSLLWFWHFFFHRFGYFSNNNFRRLFLNFSDDFCKCVRVELVHEMTFHCNMVTQYKNQQLCDSVNFDLQNNQSETVERKTHSIKA